MRLFGCAKPVESCSELDPNLPCQVKDNQGKLADALKEFFADAEAAGFGALPVSRSETVEKGHGRIETRSNALWLSDLTWLDRAVRQHWPNGIGMVARTRVDPWQDIDRAGVLHRLALRKFALSLLRQDMHYPKRSLRGRRKTADRLPDYRASLLGLAPRG